MLEASSEKNKIKQINLVSDAVLDEAEETENLQNA